jgi:hypothetical protein
MLRFHHLELIKTHTEKLTVLLTVDSSLFLEAAEERAGFTGPEALHVEEAGFS